MTSPLISAIMAAFNSGKYLRAAIDSILAQTEQNFELIIVNDGSTDDTEAIVQSYDSAKIRYYANPKNLGIAKTRNRAIELARGEYIAITDSDDIHHPQRLAIQSDYLQHHPQVGVVGSEPTSFSAPEPPPMNTFKTDSVKIGYTAEENLIALIYGHAVVADPTAMIRASVLAQHHIAYDSDFIVSTDHDFYKRLGVVTDMVVLDCSLLFYRVHPSSTSQQNGVFGDLDIAKMRVRFAKKHFKVDLSDVHDENGLVPIDRFRRLNALVEKIIHCKSDNPRFTEAILHQAGVRFLYLTLREIEERADDYDAVYAAYRQTALLRHIKFIRKLRFRVKALFPRLLSNT